MATPVTGVEPRSLERKIDHYVWRGGALLQLTLGLRHARPAEDTRAKDGAETVIKPSADMRRWTRLLKEPPSSSIRTGALGIGGEDLPGATRRRCGTRDG